MLFFKFEDTLTGTEYEIVADDQERAEKALPFGVKPRLSETKVIPFLLIKVIHTEEAKSVLGFDPNLVSTP